MAKPALVLLALSLAWVCGAQPRLVRLYDVDAGGPVDLSPDGALLLTRMSATVKCPDGKPYCHAEKLFAFETKTGKRIAELTTGVQESPWFAAVGFVDMQSVSLVQAGYKTTSTWIRWNPMAGTRHESPLPADERIVPVCSLDARRLLLLRRSGPNERSRLTLQVLDRGNRFTDLLQPDLMGALDFDSNFNCRSWRRGDRFLLEGTEGEGNVRPVRRFLVSTAASVPYEISRFETNERVHGHAFSPDGSLVVIITGDGPVLDGIMGPGYRVFANILRGEDGTLLRRMELVFPEKPVERRPLLAPANKYLAHGRFAGDFAKRITISPNNAMLAIAYSVRTGDLYSNADAFFGVYSLVDGHRLATLKGDTFHNGIWLALKYGDLVPTYGAPLRGALFFSPDSTLLYAGSERTWQWDLSRLP